MKFAGGDCKEQECQISGVNLKANMNSKEYNNLLNQFRNQLTGQQRIDYGNMTPEQKHDYCAQWVLDPQLCTTQGFNKSFVFSEVKNKEKVIWVTETQLGGPLYLNSPELATIVTEAKDLEDYFGSELHSCLTNLKKEPTILQSLNMQKVQVFKTV